MSEPVPDYVERARANRDLVLKHAPELRPFLADLNKHGCHLGWSELSVRLLTDEEKREWQAKQAAQRQHAAALAEIERRGTHKAKR